MFNRRKKQKQKDQAHKEEIAMIEKQKDTAIRKGEEWKKKILERIEQGSETKDNGTETDPAVQAG